MSIARLAEKLNVSLSLAQLARRPLELHHHKPLAIKMAIPKFEESYNPNKHYDPDRERTENAKLQKELKREKKVSSPLPENPGMVLILWRLLTWQTLGCCSRASERCEGYCYRKSPTEERKGCCLRQEIQASYRRDSRRRRNGGESLRTRKGVAQERQKVVCRIPCARIYKIPQIFSIILSQCTCHSDPLEVS